MLFTAVSDFFYIPSKIYKTNYLLHYLLITLRNTTRTIIPRGAIDYDNHVAINIERNKNYWVNQERCTTRPQSRTQEPPTDSHNLSRRGLTMHRGGLNEVTPRPQLKNLENMGRIGHVVLHHDFPSKQHPSPDPPIT